MFLVLKLPRTGSTMLGKVLDSHSDITCVNEVLNSVKDADLQTKMASLTDHFATRLPNPAGPNQAIVGATINPFKYKLSPRHLQRAIAAIPGDRQAPEELKIVMLLRKNKLKQAASAYMAIERGKWESNLKNLDGDSNSKKWFDLGKLQWMAFKYWLQSYRLIRFTQAMSGNYLQVFYEDLLEQPEATFGQIFDYLGATPVSKGFDFSAGYRKIASDDIRDAIANYDSMRRYPFLRAYME
ncbi:sulfotransferase [Synechococcus sp. PCC 7336]|uniref:sulfotransferase family protein n=1 Tax=Synechococcus sp. PCC 7336 TaxID=195250 RepID=UPI000349D3BC|nr:sulfotransferase [Synechococcus sp. PCC 7336]